MTVRKNIKIGVGDWANKTGSCLWSGLKYGVDTLSVTLEELKTNGWEYGLATRDHKVLSMLGICQNIDKEWRYISPWYGKMDVHHLKTEATVALLNIFIQHYGTNTFYNSQVNPKGHKAKCQCTYYTHEKYLITADPR